MPATVNASVFDSPEPTMPVSHAPLSAVAVWLTPFSSFRHVTLSPTFTWTVEGVNPGNSALTVWLAASAATGSASVRPMMLGTSIATSARSIRRARGPIAVVLRSITRGRIR